MLLHPSVHSLVTMLLLICHLLYYICGCVRVCVWWLPVGVLLRKEEEGVIGGVTGGVRFPLVWRGGVETLLRDRLPARGRDDFGCTFFFRASCSRRAASVMNLTRWSTKRFFILSEKMLGRNTSDYIPIQKLSLLSLVNVYNRNQMLTKTLLKQMGKYK